MGLLIFEIIFNYIPIADIRQPAKQCRLRLIIQSGAHVAPLQRKSRALPALDLRYNLAGRFNTGLGRIVSGKHAGDFQDMFPV